MIVYRQDLQALECSDCGAFEELLKKTARDAEALVNAREDAEHDHAECSSFVGRPEMQRKAVAANRALREEVAAAKEKAKLRRAA